MSTSAQDELRRPRSSQDCRLAAPPRVRPAPASDGRRPRSGRGRSTAQAPHLRASLDSRPVRGRPWPRRVGAVGARRAGSTNCSWRRCHIAFGRQRVGEVLRRVTLGRGRPPCPVPPGGWGSPRTPGRESHTRCSTRGTAAAGPTCSSRRSSASADQLRRPDRARSARSTTRRASRARSALAGSVTSVVRHPVVELQGPPEVRRSPRRNSPYLRAASPARARSPRTRGQVVRGVPVEGQQAQLGRARGRSPRLRSHPFGRVARAPELARRAAGRRRRPRGAGRDGSRRARRRRGARWRRSPREGTCRARRLVRGPTRSTRAGRSRRLPLAEARRSSVAGRSGQRIDAGPAGGRTVVRAVCRGPTARSSSAYSGFPSDRASTVPTERVVTTSDRCDAAMMPAMPLAVERGEVEPAGARRCGRSLPAPGGTGAAG